MRKVKVAAVQMSMSSSREENISKAEKLVREAAAEGANIVLLPELLKRHIFAKKEITIIILLLLRQKRPCCYKNDRAFP